MLFGSDKVKPSWLYFLMRWSDFPLLAEGVSRAWNRKVALSHPSFMRCSSQEERGQLAWSGESLMAPMVRRSPAVFSSLQGGQNVVFAPSGSLFPRDLGEFWAGKPLSARFEAGSQDCMEIEGNLQILEVLRSPGTSQRP